MRLEKDVDSIAKERKGLYIVFMMILDQFEPNLMLEMKVCIKCFLVFSDLGEFRGFDSKLKEEDNILWVY